jgi:hypothetical protein
VQQQLNNDLTRRSDVGFNVEVLAVSGEECTADVVGGKRWPQNVCSDWS